MVRQSRALDCALIDAVLSPPMLDSKILRNDVSAVAANLARRGFQFDIEEFAALEARRKEATYLHAEDAGVSKTVGYRPGRKGRGRKRR